jgi:hypothetical protein
MAGPFQAGQKITAAALSSFAAPLAVIKPSDQSVTSSTTLVNDNALFLPVAASATYLFQFYLDWEGLGGSGNGIQGEWAVPAGATLRYQATRIDATNNVIVNLTFKEATSNWISEGGGAGVLQAVSGLGTLVTGVTTGNLQLKWTQAASSATPTIVHAQSFVALWRIT